MAKKSFTKKDCNLLFYALQNSGGFCLLSRAIFTDGDQYFDIGDYLHQKLGYDKEYVDRVNTNRRQLATLCEAFAAELRRNCLEYKGEEKATVPKTRPV